MITKLEDLSSLENEDENDDVIDENTDGVIDENADEVIDNNTDDVTEQNAVEVIEQNADDVTNAKEESIVGVNVKTAKVDEQKEGEDIGEENKEKVETVEENILNEAKSRKNVRVRKSKKKKTT